VPNPPSADKFREETAEASEADTTSADGTSADESSHERSRSLGPDGPLDTVRLAGKAAKTGWNMLTQEDETETSFRGNIGTVKRAGWTEAIDLATVKEVGGAYDATVNDVLLAALAGAFRRVLQERGDPVEGRELRVTVPINLRPMHRRDGSLGNYFGLAFVPLPVGEPDLGERIRIIHERMDEETAGLEAFLMYLTLTFGGHTPDFILDLLIEQFENQATGVVTNVPGPLDTVEFAGHEVSDIMFWVPQANDQGIGISIFSYDGSVRLGIAGDANLLSDPDELSEAFRAEIDAEAADVE
ncbi:MAG: diacylglycerol O-acyltransferase, partial [Natronomonas sp.]